MTLQPFRLRYADLCSVDQEISSSHRRSLSLSSVADLISLENTYPSLLSSSHLSSAHLLHFAMPTVQLFRDQPITEIQSQDPLDLSYTELARLREFMALPAFQTWAAPYERLTRSIMAGCPLLRAGQRYDGGMLSHYMGWEEAFLLPTASGALVGRIILPKLIEKMCCLWPLDPSQVHQVNQLLQRNLKTTSKKEACPNLASANHALSFRFIHPFRSNFSLTIM